MSTRSHAHALLALPDWLSLQRRLLELERGAELAEATSTLASGSVAELEARGVVLPRVTVLDSSTGLFGRLLLRCGDHLGRSLPSHRFSAGDIVGLRVLGGGGGGGGPAAAVAALAGGGDVRAAYDASGVVTAADEKGVTVALDEGGGGEEARAVGAGDRVRVDKLADDVTFKRLKEVIGALEGRGGARGPAERLLGILFQGGVHGGKPPPANDTGAWCTPAFLPAVPPVPSRGGGGGGGGAAAAAASGGWAPFHAGLNAGQSAAVAAALRATDLLMIHGPPGTGKTTTVVEYIRQEVARGRRVLACAPSNVAVDNLLERLASGGGGLKLLRLGHPARVTPALQSHTLEAVLGATEGAAIVGDVKRDLARVGEALKRARDKAARRELRAEERALRREVRVREERVLSDALRGADVVLCTVTGAGTRVLLRGVGTPPAPARFDVTVIDEVAQAVEVACLAPVAYSPKLVIAGDHCQLAPTINSEDAAAGGLQFTLADRMVRLFGEGGGAARGEAPLCHFMPTLPVVHM